MRAKPGQLKAQWGRVDRWSDKDVCYIWGDGVPKCDSRLLHSVLSTQRMRLKIEGGHDFEPSFLEELEVRGYDITTIRFSIQKKATTP